jgi:hypothetical protein
VVGLKLQLECWECISVFRGVTAEGWKTGGGRWVVVRVRAHKGVNPLRWQGKGGCWYSQTRLKGHGGNWGGGRYVGLDVFD